MFWSNGYSLVGAKPDAWHKTIGKLARDLPRVVREFNAGYVAVQGTSGLAAAFALRALLDDTVRFVIVRKPDEKAHSGDIVAIGESFEPDYPRFVFLDDLIDSGATLCRVAEKLWQHDCAAVVTYNGDGQELRKDGSFVRTITTTLVRYDEEAAMAVHEHVEKRLSAARLKYSVY